jgi:hypothetical protein
MRAHTPGGRFDADFETDAILDGMDWDLRNPVGTTAEWYVFDPQNSEKDPIYDTSSSTGQRVWLGPYKIPVVRAIIKQGQVSQSERGLYNTDTLHLTLNARDVEEVHPGVIQNPDLQNRGRIVWRNQVYRPFGVQERGIIAERFTLIVVDCIQIASEEMINDPQFLQFAN